MRFAFFTHSVVSDWNHGNAHFLRGVARALVSLGHEVRIHEPEAGWSRRQLIAHEGPMALTELMGVCQDLRPRLYREEDLDLARVFEKADVVIVHEWTPPELVRRIGACRRAFPRCLLLFHDTHHRLVTEPDGMAAYDLSQFDGVLAFGRVLADLYLKRGLARRTFVWHEAADVSTFRPRRGLAQEGDLVWIGNWGDDERAAELREFLIEPVAALKLRASVYGVRWPKAAQRELGAAGIAFRGWLPNHRVPEAFARHRVTVHVPRRPYVEALPGIPTIRPFEALACGIPLVSAPWRDTEHLFAAGRDYLVATDGAAMRRLLAAVLARPRLRQRLRRNGLRTIRSRHTCAHRARELLAIVESLRTGTEREAALEEAVG